MVDVLHAVRRVDSLFNARQGQGNVQRAPLPELRNGPYVTVEKVIRGVNTALVPLPRCGHSGQRIQEPQHPES